MDPGPLQELMLYFIPETTDRALASGISMIEDDSPKLIAMDFEDDEGGECLVNLIGRHHPLFRNSKTPGYDFLGYLGLDAHCLVIQHWDNDDSFKEQVLGVLIREREYRRGAKHVRQHRQHRPAQV